MATPAITMMAAMIAKFAVQKKRSPMMSLANDLHGAPKPSIQLRRDVDICAIGQGQCTEEYVRARLSITEEALVRMRVAPNSLR